MSNQRGSLSLEGAIAISVFMLLLTAFYSFTYGYRLEKKAFEVATLYVLENNYEVLSEANLRALLVSDYLKVEKGPVFRAMGHIEEEFFYLSNGFSQPLDEVVFITDYGKMYHLPGCPTVKKSLRPVSKKEVPHLSPCKVCHKKTP
ncbi:MAG: hypothetical protein GX079_00795 [Tissierellia bacterium]|nr:hypothetical protein [Tissierellia bacterium]